MTDLDTILAAGQALAAVHGAVDQIINAALYYGPGVLALTTTIAAFRMCAWAADRYHQAVQDRADRAYYTARNARDQRIEYIAEAVMAMPQDRLVADLEARLAATPDLAPEEGR